MILRLGIYGEIPELAIRKKIKWTDWWTQVPEDSEGNPKVRRRISPTLYRWKNKSRFRCSLWPQNLSISSQALLPVSHCLLKAVWWGWQSRWWEKPTDQYSMPLPDFIKQVIYPVFASDSSEMGLKINAFSKLFWTALNDFVLFHECCLLFWAYRWMLFETWLKYFTDEGLLSGSVG